MLPPIGPYSAISENMVRGLTYAIFNTKQISQIILTFFCVLEKVLMVEIKLKI